MNVLLAYFLHSFSCSKKLVTSKKGEDSLISSLSQVLKKRNPKEGKLPNRHSVYFEHRNICLVALLKLVIVVWYANWT